MKKIFYNKRLIVGLVVLGIALLLNRYSLLFDFFYGFLLIMSVALLLSVLYSQFDVTRKFKILKKKYFLRLLDKK